MLHAHILFSMETGKKVLIAFDAGFLARIERERLIEERVDGRRPPRTTMIRSLATEAMDARCAARGEDSPSAVESEPGLEQPELEQPVVEAAQV
jgi:hypothetical protein